MTVGKGNRKPGVHSQKTRNQTFRLLLIQSVLCGFGSLALLLVGLEMAYSALLGGGLYLLPTAYFTHRALTFREQQTPRQALAEMYVSQIWKMGLTAAGFAAVFILIHPLNPFSLFGMFILMQIVGWIAQMNLNKRFLKL
ncbi:ATP synthase subunit I [Neptuniibacter halophilus]|uniref:ATP synthase subunit I n=1 Tax=Neptuniibacter halophilus TaxID=651666 RepID=UPI0025741B29|nr:ATP synthase subunit I [Neptuniibacter halophilus]